MFCLSRDIMNKSLEITKIFLKKIDKIRIFKKNQFFCLRYILQLLLYHCLMKKQSNKKNLVQTSGFNTIEIIFILLVKLMIIYI